MKLHCSKLTLFIEEEFKTINNYNSDRDESSQSKLSTNIVADEKAIDSDDSQKTTAKATPENADAPIESGGYGNVDTWNDTPQDS